MQPVFTIKEALSFGWKKTVEHFGFLVLTTLCFLIVGAILNSLADAKSLGVLFKLVNIVVTYFGTFTAVRIGLKIYKGEKPTVKNIFEVDWDFFGVYILASIIFVVVTGIGFILLIIPGIIIAIRYGFFRFVLIDEHSKIKHSFKKSFSMTKGLFWPLLWFFVVICLVNILGAIALGIGLLFTIPLSSLATVHVYEKLKLSHVNLGK